MNLIRVMQLIDSLAIGGGERMAVNVANHLPQDRYESHLCTTRDEGPLVNEVRPHVRYFALMRKQRWDIGAFLKLRRYLIQNEIHIIHAHSSSLFIARLCSFGLNIPIVWHDHFGKYKILHRPVWLYRLATLKIGGVIAVNEPLAGWALEKLLLPEQCVRFIPNFVSGVSTSQKPIIHHNAARYTLVCVAQLRPQKDHITLVEAIAQVKEVASDFHLLIVGGGNNRSYINAIRDKVEELDLSTEITLLGEKTDVASILLASDIGVLSSQSEGFPLVLLEYAAAKLPVVATDVGQCREILDDGNAGLVVPAKSPSALAEAIISLLQSPEQRHTLGQRLHQRYLEHYSPEAAIAKIASIYEQILANRQ